MIPNNGVRILDMAEKKNWEMEKNVCLPEKKKMVENRFYKIKVT